MLETAPSYLRPSAVDRILGHTLAFFVWIGLIRGHFYVLEVRGPKTGKTLSLPVDPLDLDGRRYLVCARGNSMGAQCSRGRRSRARPRDAPPLRRARASSRRASAGSQSLS